MLQEYPTFNSLLPNPLSLARSMYTDFATAVLEITSIALQYATQYRGHCYAVFAQINMECFYHPPQNTGIAILLRNHNSYTA